MTIARLVFRELLFRKWNTLLSLVSIAAAVACLLGALVILRTFDRRNEAELAAKEQALVKQMDQKEKALFQQMAQMEDSYRKITKKMGFNILVLPHDQNLSDFYADNFADKLMPAEYAQRLAAATNVASIRHVLPMLQQRMEWPEQKRKVLLIGVQGHMTYAAKAGGEEPLVRPVQPGTVALGYELHHSLGLTNHAEIVFMGHKLRVSATNPERGTIDDITLWVDLGLAQSLLGHPEQISCIVALECECGWGNLPLVRQEIAAVLPDTQVLELAGKALARAEARQEADRNAKEALERERTGKEEALERERESREVQRRQREERAAVLVPLVLAACALWVGLLAWMNMRERRVEIGILRALGLQQMHIAMVFLAKAAFLGLVGALIGGAVGVPLAAVVASTPGGIPAGIELIGWATVAAVILLAPLVVMLASWIPALLAAQQDPAHVLREG